MELFNTRARKKRRTLRTRIERGLLEQLMQDLPEVEVEAIPSTRHSYAFKAPQAGGSTVLHFDKILDTLTSPHIPQNVSRSEMVNFVEMAKATLSVSSPVLDLSKVYFALRHQSYLKEMPTPVPTRAALGDCVLLAICDEGNHTFTVSSEFIEKSKLTNDDVWEAAAANTGALLDFFEVVDGPDGIMTMTLEGYEWLANVLLLRIDVLDLFMQYTELEHAFMIAPERAGVNVIDATRRDALEILEARLLSAKQGPHCQSEVVFRYSKGAEKLMPCYILEGGRLHTVCN